MGRSRLHAACTGARTAKPDGRTTARGGRTGGQDPPEAVASSLPIYEAEFLGLSYGFRPGRKAHDALDALAYGIERRKVNWIVDADIRTFFDAIDRDRLLRFVERRIGDRRVLRLAQVAERRCDGRGDLVGLRASSPLANVYLHYGWTRVRTWRPRVPKAKRSVPDDFVAGFQRRADAKRFQKPRAGTAPGKDATGGVLCGSGSATTRGAKTGDVRLSGVHALLPKTRKGSFRLGRKPSAKRMNRTLRRVGERLWRQRHADHWEVGKWLSRVLNGSTILRFRGVRDGCKASAIGCNGDGCERCGAGPSVTASVGDGCDG